MALKATAGLVTGLPANANCQDGSTAFWGRAPPVAALCPVLNAADGELHDTVGSAACACAPKDDSNPANAMNRPVAAGATVALKPFARGMFVEVLNFTIRLSVGCLRMGDWTEKGTGLTYRQWYWAYTMRESSPRNIVSVSRIL